MQVILIVLWMLLHERWKSQILFVMLSYSVKCMKKLLQTTVPLGKCIQSKVCSRPVKNVWISSVTLIFIFWWIELAILRSHTIAYQNFIFKFEDIWHRKFAFFQTLIALIHTGKPVPYRVLVEISRSDGFYMLRVSNFVRSLVIAKIE